MRSRNVQIKKFHFENSHISEKCNCRSNTFILGDITIDQSIFVQKS